MNRLPRWRIAAAALILAVLGFVLAVCAPYYFRNLRFQNYVAGLTRNVENREKPDATLRALILQRAQQLELPITADNVHIRREPDGSLKQISVKYMVPIDLPGYSVKLHFYPGAGSR